MYVEAELGYARRVCKGEWRTAGEECEAHLSIGERRLSLSPLAFAIACEGVEAHAARWAAEEDAGEEAPAEGERGGEKAAREARNAAGAARARVAAAAHRLALARGTSAGALAAGARRSRVGLPVAGVWDVLEDGGACAPPPPALAPALLAAHPLLARAALATALNFSATGALLSRPARELLTGHATLAAVYPRRDDAPAVGEEEEGGGGAGGAVKRGKKAAAAAAAAAGGAMEEEGGGGLGRFAAGGGAEGSGEEGGGGEEEEEEGGGGGGSDYGGDGPGGEGYPGAEGSEVGSEVPWAAPPVPSPLEAAYAAVGAGGGGGGEGEGGGGGGMEAEEGGAGGGAEGGAPADVFAVAHGKGAVAAKKWHADTVKMLAALASLMTAPPAPPGKKGGKRKSAEMAGGAAVAPAEGGDLSDCAVGVGSAGEPLSFRAIIAGAGAAAAARAFFQLLVLCSWDVVKTHQGAPFGDIAVARTPLFAKAFASHSSA